MAQTLLQLVNAAERELGFTASTTVIDNTDEQAVQFLNLLNGLGVDMVREHDWQGLQTEYLFSTVFFEYTGTTTVDSTTLSALSSTTGLTTNPTRFTVTGTGIRSDSNLVSVNAGAATAVIGREASSTGTGRTLTFSQVKYAMPSDYDRLIDRTDWDKSQNWEIIGPETPQQWQWLKSSNLSTGGPRTRFRVYGDLFVVFPPPTSERDMRFEYISDFWVILTAATIPTKASLTVDTDINIFPDRLLVTGLKLRYAESNGIDWLIPSLTKQWMRQLDFSKAADAGNATLSMGGRYGSALMGWANVPDSGYGS